MPIASLSGIVFGEAGEKKSIIILEFSAGDDFGRKRLGKPRTARLGDDDKRDQKTQGGKKGCFFYHLFTNFFPEEILIL
jgi:hypothetical protein